MFGFILKILRVTEKTHARERTKVNIENASCDRLKDQNNEQYNSVSTASNETLVVDDLLLVQKIQFTKVYKLSTYNNLKLFKLNIQVGFQAKGERIPFSI